MRETLYCSASLGAERSGVPCGNFPRRISARILAATFRYLICRFSAFIDSSGCRRHVLLPSAVIIPGNTGKNNGDRLRKIFLRRKTAKSPVQSHSQLIPYPAGGGVGRECFFSQKWRFQRDKGGSRSCRLEKNGEKCYIPADLQPETANFYVGIERRVRNGN